MVEKTLIITDKQIKEYISVEDAISLVEQTWRWYSEGKIIMPSKVTTNMETAGVYGWFNSMPSYIAPLNVAGVKIVGGYSNNLKRGMPYIKANMLLTDPDSGFLRAVMCGDWISNYRTGAQPAIAAKYLASKTDVVTIIGAGLQGFHCLDCMSRILNIKEVRVCDINVEARERFIARFPNAPFKLISCDSNEEGCYGADVVITITSACAVLVEEPWIKAGGLVMTMGSYTEISEELSLKSDKLFVDQIAQGLHRGNFKEMTEKGLINEKSFAAELPDVVTGKAGGRDNDEQRIVAAIVGMGCLDLAIATEVYNRIVASKDNVVSVNMLD
ncbi:MAG: ornithine cyclodeaminase family protein [Clostridiales bacterium]|nr:ornithine cyclodeaminase family protein [Clostridiales bacterium]